MADGRRILNPQHPQEDLLCQLGGPGWPPCAPQHERRERGPVRDEQSLNQLLRADCHAGTSPYQLRLVSPNRTRGALRAPRYSEYSGMLRHLFVS